MCTIPILVVLDFTKIFFLECDASSRGLGSILMQGFPMAFTNKHLCHLNFGKSTYEKKNDCYPSCVRNLACISHGKEFIPYQD